MPRDPHINSVLVLGAGPIIIGQGCEFDYSGTQACKALKDENCRVILVNSNPATIMTDSTMADATYIEPITLDVVSEIIKKERPDAILPIVGGQTALNCAVNLFQKGILEKYRVKLIGATYDSITKAENRELFKQAASRAQLETPRSVIANNLDDAFNASNTFEFPVIIRTSFTLGGTGSGIAYNENQFKEICQQALAVSNQVGILIEESILGWKEYELELMQDSIGNCIVVCSIENFDPMGIHTGDSITVAPAQTLTDKEYQYMRQAAFKIMSEIGMATGGCNVQFAVNPTTGERVVIEINPRVSRSSALASKATGFPIAKVATKIALGYTLTEIKNDVTNHAIPASFEPSLDYIVTKIPRFNFDKYPDCDDTLSTCMQSVGEIMAIGRNFKESLHKAMRSLEIGSGGFESQIKVEEFDKAKLKAMLRKPHEKRLWYIGDALRNGFDVKEIASLTAIDPWFLTQIKEIIDIEQKIKNKELTKVDRSTLYELKRIGFSDVRLAHLFNVHQKQFRSYRTQLKIAPVYKRIDTCAGEFPTETAYFYSTYERNCEARPSKNKKIVIIGSGPNRIGQGIEFDYCCVHAARALQEFGYKAIIINCNPETVSTDYDTADRLYFEPITLENVLDIIELEQPEGVLLQFGGQTPLNLAAALSEMGVKLIGTSLDIIDHSENRQLFKSFLQRLNLKQPHNVTFTTRAEALSLSKQFCYPMVLRPSYVIGGQAISIIYNEIELTDYLNKFSFNGSPILMEQFLENAIEIEVDALCGKNQTIICGIMEQFEPAGIHSGDSSCYMPPLSLSKEMEEEIKKIVNIIATSLQINGLINVQFAIYESEIYVLEVNPRASRTVPFLSKATGIPLIKYAVACMLGNDMANLFNTQNIKLVLPSVKMPVFSCHKFKNNKRPIGIEMKSTGEVMGIGGDLSEAWLKAEAAVGDNKSSLKINRPDFIEKRSNHPSNILCLQQIYKKLT